MLRFVWWVALLAGFAAYKHYVVPRVDGDAVSNTQTPASDTPEQTARLDQATVSLEEGM